MSEIDLDNYDPTEGVQQAKKKFSLKDRLKAVSHRTAKILIFTDEPAIDEYNRIKQIIADKEMRLMAVTGTIQNVEEAEKLETDLAQLRQDLDEARLAMLEGALSFHLSGTAKELVSAAQRKGRKTYGGKGGEVPADKIEDFSNYLQTEYLLLTLRKIVDSDGDEAEFDRDDLYNMVIGADLPPTQSRRLLDAVDTILQIDGYEQSATEDPGF